MEEKLSIFTGYSTAAGFCHVHLYLTELTTQLPFRVLMKEGGL